MYAHRCISPAGTGSGEKEEEGTGITGDKQALLPGGKEMLKDTKNYVIEQRRKFHRIPEVSMEEKKLQKPSDRSFKIWIFPLKRWVNMAP